MIDFEEKVFVYDQKKWQKLLGKNPCLPDAPTVTELDNAAVLPLRKRTDVSVRYAAYEGGVCDADGKFAAGLCRSLKNPDCNLSCMKGYVVPADEMTVRHETVVFGGVLNGAFPHVLGENLSRLWWFADHPDTKHKIVFLESPAFGGFHSYQLLAALGLTPDKFEMITTPTRFDKVIVPQENYYMLDGYRPGVEKFFAYVSSSVKPAPFKKVFLSDTTVQTKEVTLGEDYFEEFYAKRGFEIVHPDKLSYAERLSIVAGADEIVTPESSNVLLAQFCKPDAKVVMLTKAYDPCFYEIIAMQGIFKNCSVVNAHFNFLPASLAGGASVFLMGPTWCFKEYLDKCGCDYDEDELSLEKHVSPKVYDYLKAWTVAAGQVSTYKKDYRNKTLIDILDWVNVAFLGNHINRQDYPPRDVIGKLQEKCSNAQNVKDEIAAVEAENDELKKGNKKLKKKLDGMEKSFSWRVTKPFRAVKRVFCGRKKKAKA